MMLLLTSLLILLIHKASDNLNCLLLPSPLFARLIKTLVSKSLLFLLLALASASSIAKAPAIQLATNYRQDIDINQYFVSEKLDGIRAYWNGHTLVSKQGNDFTAPLWFIKNFPNVILDGELWIARGEFEKVSSIVRTQNSQNKQWQQVKFMIFDLPTSSLPFVERINKMQQLVTYTNSSYLQLIKQQKLNNSDALFALLDKVIMNQGEGLMLHHQDALYQSKRSRDLMKLKKFEDAEAKVIAHLPGKGKYVGLLGSLLVETSDGIRFKIGSGFSDKERQNPPAIGSIITYRFTGRTANNIPRFASFMRVRVIY